MKTKLVTARFDEDVFTEIAFLRNKLQARTTTEVITEAIHFLYNDMIQKEKKKSPFELLEELGLIGCMDDKPNLSSDYKKNLSTSLEKKHRSCHRKRSS